MPHFCWQFLTHTFLYPSTRPDHLSIIDSSPCEPPSVGLKPVQRDAIDIAAHDEAENRLYLRSD